MSGSPVRTVSGSPILSFPPVGMVSFGTFLAEIIRPVESALVLSAAVRVSSVLTAFIVPADVLPVRLGCFSALLLRLLRFLLFLLFLMLVLF